MSKKIGLALGGGAARGIAHIGIIETLEENGIRPSIVTGTSIGSVIGAAYSAGKMKELKEFLLSVDILKMLSFFQIKIPKNGLFDGMKISRFFEENLMIGNIEDLEKTFAAISCDYYTGERVVIDRGNTITALRASYSIPGLFTPVKYQGRLLIDGGIVDPVPVSAARELGADLIIAVDLNYQVRWRRQHSKKGKEQKSNWIIKKHPLWIALENKFGKKVTKEVSPGIIEIMLDSFYMMEMHLTNYELEITRPDVILRPNLKEITFMDFNKTEEGILMGRKETERMMNEIQKTIDP